MREVLKIYDNSRMSVGDSPSLNFIGDTVGDTAPHSMSEMYGIRFATGNSPTTGAISLSDFRNQVITEDWDTGTKILASDRTAYDGFGVSVAISGDYAIVGAYQNDDPTDSGSAYIFRRTGTNTWNTWDAGTKIVASDAVASDEFGYSVGIDGDYAIVGARRNDDPTDSGSAYIFRRTGTNTWDAGTKIVASDRAVNDQFGWSVGISGDYAIVGAQLNDGPTDSGSAYIFRRTGTNTWDTGIKILASDRAANDNFGKSVGISGDYAIVGAAGNDDPTDSGSAYIFRRTGTNTWDTGIKILASDAVAGDQFGWSVGISGDYAIVGAYRNDDPTDSGSAYIFRRTGTNTWDTGIKILASDAAANDEFGWSVGISGDYAIVGAWKDDDPGESGSAYIFRRTGTNTWDAGTKFIASDAAGSDYFGFSVAISGDNTIMGAVGTDSAYIFVNGAYI
jgi:hypothetical protein